MTIPLRVGGPNGWRQFLRGVEGLRIVQQGAEAISGGRDVGRLSWTLWLDPGTHTGLAAAVYFTLPASIPVALGYGPAARQAAAFWRKASDVVGEGDLGFAATGKLVLARWAEFLSGGEVDMVSTAVSRVRDLGATWTGGPDWDIVSDPDGVGLGPAGVGCERFVNLRADRSQDYLSPVRVTAMFDYAMGDEFGIETGRQSPADMKHAFGPQVLHRIGMWESGPDHVRDALGHVLLALRKS